MCSNQLACIYSTCCVFVFNFGFTFSSVGQIKIADTAVIFGFLFVHVIRRHEAYKHIFAGNAVRAEPVRGIGYFDAIDIEPDKLRIPGADYPGFAFELHCARGFCQTAARLNGGAVVIPAVKTYLVGVRVQIKPELGKTTIA